MEINYDEKSCGIVLFREKNGEKLFLLLHYPGGHWDFPKGHVEKGEEEKETAARELLEETGIADVWFIDGFREEISYHHGNDKVLHKQVIFFLGKTEFKDVRISHEHKAFKWLPYNEAMDRLTYDNAKKTLKSAKIFLES